ncbi:hypothetical protein Ancab_007167 [Ancistrocladus abbreviatus]
MGFSFGQIDGLTCTSLNEISSSKDRGAFVGATLIPLKAGKLSLMISNEGMEKAVGSVLDAVEETPSLVPDNAPFFPSLVEPFSYEEWYENVEILEINFSFSPFWIQLHNLPWNLLLVVNAIKIGRMIEKVIGTDDVSDERLPDRHFLRVKMKRLPDFCFNCGRLEHKCDVCHSPVLDSYSTNLRASDLSDKHAKFLSIQEVHALLDEEESFDNFSVEDNLVTGGRRRPSV